MFATGTLNDSTILRLRVRGSDLDPLALRGRLQNLLNEVSLQPRLPASATLFIRKLNDPLPGALELDSAYPRAPQAWRHAFNTRFEQLVTSAVRPARGAVADSAESVVFYDYAELLASLSADWCSGSVATRWWWQSLIKRGDLERVIKGLWREKIEYAPAALEHLVKRGAVVEFVSRFSDGEVREMVQRVVQVFALHALPVTQITRIEGTDLAPEPMLVNATNVRHEMPWRHVVPETDTPQLRAPQQLFLGIGLMVQRAPARVRTQSFAREVERWREQVVEVSVEPEVVVVEDMAERMPPQTPASSIPISVNPLLTAPVPVAAELPEERSVSSVAEVEKVQIGNAVFRFEKPDVTPPLTMEPVPTEAKVESEPPHVQIEQTVEPTHNEAFVIPSTTLEAIAIETELGGLFYLINLAIFLEISDEDLSIWDFVVIVGREINQDRDLEDPIWTELQELQEVQDENLVNPVPAWLAELMPHLQTRLRKALGIDAQADLAQLLLHQHARVTITPTHLDVFFALAEHPIEIRLSGLDRNPGWVPAAGRFIAFHYD